MSTPDTLRENRLNALSREFQPHERAVRGHHPVKDVELIRALAKVSSPTTIEQVVQVFCRDETKGYRLAKKFTEESRIANAEAVAFRRQQGVDPYDDSYPTSLPDDYIGNNPTLYTQRRTRNYLEMLRAPDTDIAVLGPYKDGICRSCIFGKGQGGLHCERMDFLRESLKIEEFLDHAREYFDARKSQGRRGRFPETEITSKETRFDPPQVWTEYDEGALVKHTRKREIHEVTMPLGLYRDMITWLATDGKYFTYSGFIRAKGLRIASQ